MQEINNSQGDQITDPVRPYTLPKGSSLKEKISYWFVRIYTRLAHWQSVIVFSPFFQKHRKPIIVGTLAMCTMLLLLTIPSVRKLFRSRSDRWEQLQEEVAGQLSLTIDKKAARLYFPQEFRRDILVSQLDTFYTDRMYTPAWIGEDGNSAMLDSLLVVLANAGQEGLDTSAYQLTKLRQLRHSLSLKTKPAEIANLDRLATASYMVYASHILWGRVDPAKLDTMWQTSVLPFTLAKHLEKAIEDKQLQTSLTSLLPESQYYSYEALKQQFIQLCQQQQKGGWTSITTSQTLHKGSSGAAVKQLKIRLIAEGDLSAAQTNIQNIAYDQAVADAVKSYQTRYGLQVTGTLTKETRQSLAVPLEKRIQQVAINLERLRWLPRQYPAQSVWINIPEYSLRVWDKDSQVWETRIVVGKPNRPTPVLTDTLEYIILNPDWIIPRSIAADEMLPKIRQTPELLEENEFEIYESWKAGAPLVDITTIDWDTISVENFTYKIAQKPGDKNALGKVKFVFPNHYDTYLHDTPAKGLFNVNNRAYSHGCVRVENPLKLAYYLLKNTGDWTEEKIIEQTQFSVSENEEEEPDTVIKSEKIELKKPIAVTTLYLTAFVRQGKLHFCPDIYGYDTLQETALRYPLKSEPTQMIADQPKKTSKKTMVRAALTSLFAK